MGLSSIAHKAAHFAAATLNNPLGIGGLSVALVVVPIIGMHLVHKYGSVSYTHLTLPTICSV